MSPDRWDGARVTFTREGCPMEFLSFAGLILALIAAILLIAGYLTMRYSRKLLAQAKATPRCSADEVAHQAPGAAKMVGSVIAPVSTVRSPLSRTPCVYYRFQVEEEVTTRHVDTSRDSQGHTVRTVRTSKQWHTIIDDSRSVTCGIEDKGGAIEVALREADFLLEVNASDESGLFNTLEKRTRRVLENYGRVSHGLLDALIGNPLRCTEHIIVEGQNLLVLGKVRLVQTPHGVRPRFVRGKQRLFVTDRSEKQLISHLKGKLIVGYLILAGGALLGILGALLFASGQYFRSTDPSQKPIAEQLASPSADVRKKAIDAVAWELTFKQGKIKLEGAERERAADLIVQTLKDPDPDLANRAGKVVSLLATARHQEDLIRALQSPHEEVRRGALNALATIGTARAAEAIVPLLAADSKNFGIGELTQALRKIGKPAEPAVLQAVVTNSYKGNFFVAGDLFGFLGDFGTPASIPALQKLEAGRGDAKEALEKIRSRHPGF